jgi:hypothetical protein
MQRILLLVLTLAVVGTAQADVFVTKDAQGRPVYTDRPDSLPAQKVNVATQSADTVEAQRRTDEQAKAAAAAAGKAQPDSARQTAGTSSAREMTETDKAKRCEEARARYMTVMNSQRLYEQGPNEGERRYLDSDEIDAARENSKKVMDEFCSGQ